MNITVDGVVLRSVNYRESDKILTVLTRERGKITVKAQGARRKSSRLGSLSQPFCYAEMSLFEQGGRYTLDDGFVKAQFYGLTTDIEKMGLASYLAQVLLGEPEESAVDDDLMRLTLNSFYAIEKGMFTQAAIKAAFELRYMAICGYTPDLSECTACGESTSGYINLESGMLMCRDCLRAPRYNDYYLDASALEAARYILDSDLKRLFSFSIPEQSMALLSRFCEAYLLDKTEQGYKALDFYKSLFPQEGSVK
ncbi:MAG: DNA repair protein RecO [Clostridia bacterium]|nr:DNA repair protein RecO [Clostridia bacterium]